MIHAKLYARAGGDGYKATVRVNNTDGMPDVLLWRDRTFMRDGDDDDGGPRYREARASVIVADDIVAFQ